MSYSDDADRYSADPMTLAGRLRMMADRYFLIIGPLVMLLGIGFGSPGAAALGWTVVAVLAFATINSLWWWRIDRDRS